MAAVGRLLTAPVLGPTLAGGWGIFWNELLEGAAPGAARTVAGASTRLGGAVTGRTRVARWFDSPTARRRVSGAQPVVSCRLTRAMP